MISAENDLEISLLPLSQVLDLPSTDGFDIIVPELTISDEPSLTGTPDQVYTYAREHRPEIKAAEVRLQSSERQLARAKGYYYPSLSLSGSWGTGYSGASKMLDSTNFTLKTIPWSDQIKDNNNQTIGLYLTIPILNGWQTRTMVAKSKISVENSRLELENQQLVLRKTIQQAWADARASLKNYKASEKKRDATREAFRYAEQKFDVGVMNSVDYNNAKKDMTNAESEVLQSKFDYIFKTTVLDFYMGKPLSLRN